MQFDLNNKVIQLCAQGMEMETKQKSGEAKALFLQAWNEAINDFEKFTVYHVKQRTTVAVSIATRGRRITKLAIKNISFTRVVLNL